MKIIIQLPDLKLLIITFCALLIFSPASSAQWVLKTNGLPDDWGIGLAIDAADTNIVVISLRMEGLGKIFLTTDAGNLWDELTWPAEDQFEEAADIEIIDDNNIWFGTDKGRIYATLNGGTDWVLQFYDTNKTKFINYIEMFDELNGIAMGDGSEFENGMPVFLKTTNGGGDWVSMNNSAIGGASGDSWRRLDFVNENTGYFFESGNTPQKLYKTINGGSTWEATNFLNYAMILKFYDENFGLTYNYKDSTGIIMRTIDGGITWSENILTATGWGNDIEFVPGNPAKVWFTDNKALYFSGDSGKTWSEVNVTNDNLGGRDILFINEDIGWILCDYGKVYRTTNGGLGTTSIKANNNIPVSHKLLQNYPNPFNPETTIDYQLPVSSYVNLKVYNVLGKEITTLVSEFKQAGNHRVKFNGNINLSLSSGVYFYRLQTSDFVEIKKMLLIK